jgi:predicted O-methyltransferase YrrM
MAAKSGSGSSSSSSARTKPGYPNHVIERLFEQKLDKHVYLVDGTNEVQRVEANINPREGNLLYKLITRHSSPVYRTLEVGCAGGTSAMYITQAIHDRSATNGDAELAGTPAVEPRDFTEIDTATFPSANKEYTVGSKTLKLGVNAPDSDIQTRAEELHSKGAIHISVDPYQMGPHTGVPENEKGWQGLGVFNVYQTGMFPMMRLVQKKSHYALPQMLETYGEGSFDLVFIDGMHLYDYTLVDAFYGAMLLRKGGLLVIDDVRHPSVKEVKWYLDDNYTHFKQVDTGRVNTMGVWTKTSDDDRKWSFHCSVCKVPGRIEEGTRPRRQTRKQPAESGRKGQSKRQTMRKSWR